MRTVLPALRRRRAPRPGIALRRTGWSLAAAVALLPVAWLLVGSFAVDGRPSLDAWRDLLDPRLAVLFVSSAGMALAATALALVLGTLLALLLETRRVPFRPTLRLIALAPLLLPPYMLVAAWKPLVVHAAVQHEWVRTPAAIFLLALAATPLVFFFASQGIRGISGEILDAARLAPGGERRVVLGIILPLAAPAILLGGSLAFVLSFLDPETPVLLLVPAYATEVFLRVTRGPSAAFAAAVPGLALSLTGVLAAARWAARRGFAVTASENPSAPPPGRRAETSVLIALAAAAALLIGFPLVRLAALAGGGRAYAEAWALYADSILEGIPVTVASSAATVVLAALCLGRGGRPSPAAGALAWIPLAVPGTALGAALISIYNRPILDAVYGTPAILVVAAAARFFPVAYHALAAHLRTVPRDLWDAAEVAGLRPLPRLLRVYLPLAAPGLTLAAAAVIVLASGELAASILLAPPGHRPVPVVVSSELHYNVNLDVPAALCIFQAAVVLGMIALVRVPSQLLARSRFRAARTS